MPHVSMLRRVLGLATLPNVSTSSDGTTSDRSGEPIPPSVDVMPPPPHTYTHTHSTHACTLFRSCPLWLVHAASVPGRASHRVVDEPHGEVRCCGLVGITGRSEARYVGLGGSGGEKGSGVDAAGPGMPCMTLLGGSGAANAGGGGGSDTAERSCSGMGGTGGTVGVVPQSAAPSAKY